MRRRLTLTASIVAVIALAVPLTVGTSSAAARERHHRPAPAGVCLPAPTTAPAPTPDPTVTPAPDDDPSPSGFREDFTTPTDVGMVDSTYRDSWQPYPDGTGGKYYPDQIATVHDGVLDITLDGKRGAAGTFGNPDDAYSHVGGTFTVRVKATGGDGNGAAFMLWPSSDVWADGEIDYPEGNFDDAPAAFHHSMTPGQEASAQYLATGVDWRTWHTYSETWIPGRSITYTVDGRTIDTVTHDIPTTEHRYMFQVGNWGQPGHLLIDWVETP